ncbi:MAG: hypothetical protein PHF18_01030 [Methanosarcina sp.]|nr:hypothetical protein [Methanosarcina sp.]
MKIKKRSLPLKVDFSPVNQPEKNDIIGRRLKEVYFGYLSTLN